VCGKGDPACKAVPEVGRGGGGGQGYTGLMIQHPRLVGMYLARPSPNLHGKENFHCCITSHHLQYHVMCIELEQVPKNWTACLVCCLKEASSSNDDVYITCISLYRHVPDYTSGSSCQLSHRPVRWG
jgi:hypothetical protein